MPASLPQKFEDGVFERFTDRARKLMAISNQEAVRLNHQHIGTEHILLGLIKEGTGVATGALRKLRVDVGRVYLEVERRAKANQQREPVRTKKVLEYAIEEARASGHRYVGTEHLLLGLLRENHGIAGQVLSQFGVTAKAVKLEIGLE